MALGARISVTIDKLASVMPDGFRVLSFRSFPNGVTKEGVKVPGNFECKLVGPGDVTKTGYGKDELSAGKAACKAADDAPL